MADSREPEVTGAPSADARSVEGAAVGGEPNFTQAQHGDNRRRPLFSHIKLLADL